MLQASRKPTFVIPALPAETGFVASLAQALAIAAKDVRVEIRSREVVGGSLVFALLVLVIFNFAFDLEGEMAEMAGPGVLWVAIALAGMMGLGYVFAKEREQGGLQGLLLTPVDRSAIFLGKATGALLLTFTLEVFLLPMFVSRSRSSRIAFRSPTCISVEAFSRAATRRAEASEVRLRK